MENEWLYFPLFFSLEHKKVLIVGGGKVGTRRAKALLPFCKHITVVSLEFSKELIKIVRKENRITLIKAPFRADQLKNPFFVLAATNSESVNEEIVAECRKREIFVNHGGDKAQCDFYFPGIVRKGSLVLGVTSGGRDHKEVKDMTYWLQRRLDNGEFDTTKKAKYI